MCPVRMDHVLKNYNIYYILQKTIIYYIHITKVLLKIFICIFLIMCEFFVKKILNHARPDGD